MNGGQAVEAPGPSTSKEQVNGGQVVETPGSSEGQVNARQAVETGLSYHIFQAHFAQIAFTCRII